MARAETSDTSCSTDRPPYTTPTRTREPLRAGEVLRTGEARRFAVPTCRHPGRLGFGPGCRAWAPPPAGAQLLPEPLLEPPRLRAVGGRHEDRLGVLPPQAVEDALGRQVDLVVDQEDRVRGEAEIVERLARALHLVLQGGGGGIDHVNQQVGLRGLLERAPERSHQVVRQLADEPDRVGDQERRPPAALAAPDQGVESHEQAVFDPGAAAGQQVHDGGLAGVRVPDQGGTRQLQAPLAALAALLLDVLQVGRQARDPAPDQPAVGFELRLPHSPLADAAGLP